MAKKGTIRKAKPANSTVEEEKQLFKEISRVAKFDIWCTLKLLEKRPRHISELVDSGIAKYTLYRTVLPKLRELGAIVEGRDPSTVGGGTRVYFAVWLTEKGARLAKTLDDVKNLMGVRI